MILKQTEHYLDEDKTGLDIAMRFVVGVARNIEQVLRYYFKSWKRCGKRIRSSNCSSGDRWQLLFGTGIRMVLKWNIKEAYYSAFNQIIGNKDFQFVGRSVYRLRTH